MKINCLDGSRLFDSVQCTYNVLEQRPGEALLEAYKSGMDIIIKEGMANGRILKNEKFRNLAKNSGYSADQLALACILAQPFHPRVLSGAITPEQLSSNIKALELSNILQGEKRTLLNDVMTQCVMDSEEYWKDRSALAWN
jgi:Predicted oxidoreductases (related to aryl-alcohol dehydrogenases)